ncbi:MAG: hypothetical protein K0U68_12990 [Gammaproteobacteria bacterium]|nr:hypothetical protein [Gammaproteobacteria bacterium]
MPITLSWYIEGIPEQQAKLVANDFAIARKQIIQRIHQSRDLQTAYRRIES